MAKTNNDKRERVELSDKALSKEAIADIVGEVLTAQKEQRNSKINEKQKELALAYYDEHTFEHFKMKWGVMLFLVAVLYFEVTIFTNSYVEQVLISVVSAFGLAALLHTEYAEKGYVRKHMPSFRSKTGGQIDLFTYAIFGYSTIIKSQTIAIVSVVMLGLGFLIPGDNSLLVGVYNGVLTITFFFIVFGFHNFFVEKIQN